MTDRTRASSPIVGSPTARRASGQPGAARPLGQGGPQGNPSGPRAAHDPGSTRYGKDRATGANEPRHREQKERQGWTSRQGGDQAAGPGTRPSPDAREET